MSVNFIEVRGTDFVCEGKPFLVKGFAIGSFLNIEHFMLKLVGIEQNIRKAFFEIYGEEVSKIFWQNFEKAFFNEKDGNFLREMGVNTIRLPINYHHFYDDFKDCIKEEGFSSLERVIKICEKNGIYLILDLHTAPGGQNPDWHSDNLTGEALFWHYGVFQKKVLEIWRIIVERYKDNPIIIGYDILNEPVIEDRKTSGKIVNEFYKQIIANIRQIDNNHIIFLEGDFYANDTSSFDILEDDKIAYSIHFYPFFHVEKNLKSYLKMKREERINFLFSRLRNPLDDIKLRLKKPVWCGETGVPYKIKHLDILENLLDETLEVFEREKVSWSIWTYKDAGSMGVLFPDKEAKWNKLSDILNWSFFDEFSSSDEMAKEFIMKSVGYKEPSNELIRKVKFRLLSIKDLILVEKLKDTLRNILTSEIIKYPESFLFERCKKCDALIKVIKKWL